MCLQIYIYIYYMLTLKKLNYPSFCLKHCKCMFSDFLMSDFSRLVKYYCLMTIAVCIYYLSFAKYLQITAVIYRYIYIYIYLHVYLYIYIHTFGSCWPR